MDDELEMFTVLGDKDGDVGHWEDSVTFIKMDQVHGVPRLCDDG